MFLKHRTIPFFVFCTGAAVLIIEVLAIRILAPYYGNTIITVSSVITVVLFALSFGYYVGGALADKHPHVKLFFSIIVVSGISIILMHASAITFLPTVGYKLSLIYGPLLFSLFLFFVPSFLLGLLSPFAIKLQKLQLPDIDVGRVSGQIFFWSTLGSIVGSLSAGFILIPHFGINTIVFGTGVFLIVIGMAALLRHKVSPLFICVGAAILFFGVAHYTQSSVTLPIPYKGAVVYSADSSYQKITVLDGEYKGRPARFLIQDRNLSAAQYRDSADPGDLAFNYTKYYALYTTVNPQPEHALMIGGGAYSVPLALLATVPNVNIDVAEIDPFIYDVGKSYFHVTDNPRMHNIIADGRRYLHDTATSYDFIFSDAYASYLSTPDHLTTQEFFQLAREKLSDNGVLVANVIGSLNPKTQNFLLSEIKTFKSVFPHSYFFAVESPDFSKVQNIIFMGTKGDTPPDFNILKNNEALSYISIKLIDINKLDLANHPLLTDNFAPVEYLLSKELGNLQ